MTAEECVDAIDDALADVSRLEERATKHDSIPDRISAGLRKDALVEIETITVKYRTLAHSVPR